MFIQGQLSTGMDGTLITLSHQYVKYKPKLGYYRVMPSEPVEGVVFGRPVEG